ncbi:MAG: outer membrane beta-barrel protein [Sphingobacteriaceae bacterium]|nr:outer membrane beta-barrel protein [Sphingobacteriaceae bacterium]
MRKQLYILLLFLVSIPVQSQNFSVFAKVVDEDDSSAIGAAVSLLSISDSSIVKAASVNLRGILKIQDIPAGNYILKIEFIEYKDEFRKIEVNADLRLGKIKLKPDTKTLGEIEVTTTAVTTTQNGDTTAYNANAFKTNKDATAEDLVTKMPGVTIVDGKVQAQGEDVKQVLVDGKPYFGDDPNAVLKNLPAEVIDKVQLFDKKSDQAQFTGIDDGNTSKTINVITKAQFRNGVFGRLYGGYGYEDKYKGGAVVNRFKDKQRFTVMAMSNNINEQNFSSEDLLGVMSSGSSNSRGNSGGGSSRGSGGERGGRGGGPSGQSNSESFLVNSKNGISITNAFGINYSDQWGKNTSITSSYFFNWTDNNATTNLLRQYLGGGNSGLNYNENNTAKSNNYNHRLSIRLDHKFDSLNSILLQPKISMQTNDGLSSLSGANTQTTTLSSISNNYNSYLNGYSIAFPILYRHSFLKKGRTISLDLNPTYNPSSGTSSLTSYNAYYDTLTVIDTVDQRSNLNKYAFNSTSNLSYTEPLSKVSFLSFNYIFTYNISESTKNTFTKNAIANDYSIVDSLVSNVFNSTYMAHMGGVSFRLQKEKYSFSLGISGQQAELYKQQQFPNSSEATKVFTSILPNASYQYKFNKQNNLRANYRTNNIAPSIDQLQNVLNNSNSLQYSIGNPDLKQSFQNNLFVRYFGVNTNKSTNIFVMLGGTYTDNYIGNSTIIANKDTVVYNTIYLASGSQISRQENFNGYYNACFFFNYGFPVKFIRSNVNINTGCNYSNVPALINNKTNFSKTTSPSLGLVISSNFSDKVDFTISSNSSYNTVVNSLQTSLNSSYLNQSSKAKVNLTFFKRLVFQAEYAITIYTGLTASFNQNINLLNSAIAFKFLKDNRAELRLFVFDILNQNQSIQRNITETYIEDTQSNILQRYYMLTFTYNIKKYFPKKEETPIGDK